MRNKKHNIELNFVRKARKSKDGADGLLYRERWATGCQDLVFKDKEAASAYFQSLVDHAEHVEETGRLAMHG